MKIEIDLTEILHDDHGNPAESMAESIRRQVVETITRSAAKDVKALISERVSQTIDEALADALKERIPTIIDEVLNGTYTPIDSYGRRSEPTTFRTQIINTLQAQMVYKKASYDSDKNAFTRAVDEAVSTALKGFQKAFTEQVTAAYTRDAMAYAVEEMRKRLPPVKP